MKLSLKFRS